MALSKAEVAVPVLAEQRVVPVPELGGDVIVRPILLSDRLAMRDEYLASKGNVREFAHITGLLACAVVDGQGEPLFTRGQWDIWGARYPARTMELWDIAFELSGLSAAVAEQAEKNSQAQNSSSQ